MRLTFFRITHGGIALALALCSVALMLLAACGDTRPAPTAVPPTVAAATPVPTTTPIPSPTATPTAVPSSPDRDALKAFYESAGGENWTTSANWLSDKPLDTWHGVATDDGRVTELVLLDNGLVGNIASELGRLPNLTKLELRGNWMLGLIPSELGTFPT
ncbi:MAG: hypothetical protein F4W93_02430 [Dehalococcoidia bacterium]|nr:hypothetical protein [Dehalococcoidia bacterium]